MELYKVYINLDLGMTLTFFTARSTYAVHAFECSGDGNDMNPALPDTSMKLGRYVYKHELFEIFSLANQNYSNFQDGGSKFQDGRQNKY